MKSSVHDLKNLAIPKIEDPRGNLAVIENNVVPFEIKRVYYLFDVPSGSTRGGHAHKTLSQFIVALSGSFDVIVKDGLDQKRFSLNNPSKGLLITPGIWRELENFSSGSVCLVIASEVYDEDDYIRDFEDFTNYNRVERS
ncbi:FdtA/QdtA family cupin domain-containing protein [Algibacter miyuki]|uniref:FdtA/QdtA family cupin domain-containing protein n=1 Tax=Algibacter miyuki TaxID=1306933 RepID=A0ABV5GY57_9FLAO|nr:FdtA/QdtA family cupin domain-containing protein [Algibacter miyuki]MDN3665903.1 FdtA/QdtA family cupin domain-containing protein [Algibacter miyuki]